MEALQKDVRGIFLNVEIRNVKPINELMCGKGQYDT